MESQLLMTTISCILFITLMWVASVGYLKKKRAARDLEDYTVKDELTEHSGIMSGIIEDIEACSDYVVEHIDLTQETPIHSQTVICVKGIGYEQTQKNK